MRIIVMTNRFGDVGTHPQLTGLALHLKQSGHEVHAISLAPTGSIAPMFTAAGIDTEVVDASRRGSFPVVVMGLTTAFRTWRPETVIAFLYESIMPARVAARLAGVPVVISSIRNEYFGRRYRELMLRATEPLSTTTVVNSRVVAKSLMRRGVASSRQLSVIHNGIDLDRFSDVDHRSQTRASLGLADEDFAWLTIGRLTEQKDYPNLFGAFARVAAEATSARLLVLGRGPLDPELRMLVRRSGIDEHVTFLGYRSDVPSLIASADAFVLASRYEGLPNVVMEAFAGGIPVVGTSVGGMSELVYDGTNGYLVAPSRPDELASAMLRMMKMSTDDRHDMGMAGRVLMQERFEHRAVMREWEHLIENARAAKLSRPAREAA